MKYFLYLILGVVLYTVFIKLFNIAPYILPPISDIVYAFITNFNTLLVDSFYTIITTLTGFLIAIIIGMSLAILIDYNKKFKFSLTIIHTLQMIPTIVIAPLLIIWFGFGLGSIIFIVIVSCIFPIIVSVNNGFNQIDSDYLYFFEVNEISKFDTYKKLKIPFIITDIRSSLKIISTYAITSCILAEYMVGQQGLGVFLANSLVSFNIANAFLVVILVLIYTLIFKFVINFVLNKILRRVYGKVI